MTAAISVGFAPATTPVIGAPAAATTSTGQPAGEGGLFAALLALLAPGSNLSDTLLPDGLQAPLDGLAPTSNQLPDDLEAQLKAAAGKLGIDLASIGDLLADLDLPSETAADPETFAGAVTSLVEALAAMAEAPTDTNGTDGTAPDQLEAAVDVLLALIGTPQPAPPPAPTPSETFSQMVGDLTEALTGSGKPSGDASPPTTPADTETADAAAAASSTAPGSATADKPSTDAVRTPLVEKLVHLLDDTAKAMAAANPQLAEKLAALAKSLPALPDDLLAALDAATTDGADKSAPQLASLIDQALRPRTAQRPAATPAFAAPRLDLPVPDDKTATAPPVPPTATPKAPAASADSDPTPAASAAARPDTPAPAPNGNHPTPAAPQAEAGPDKPAETAQTPATTAVAQQAAAAPAAATRTVQAAYQQPTPINLPQVAFEIVRQVQAGNSRFQIRLDPAELGRIDVQLDVDRSGNVSARMVVDRPETLDLMQRDQRALQQALQQAGLDSSRTNLEFSLRQNPFAGDGSGNGRQQGQPGRQGGNPLLGDGGTDPIPEIYRGTAASGALNLFV